MTKSNANRRKRPENLPDAETDSTLKLGDYPLGSMESRATARALVDSKNEVETVIQVVFVSPDRTRENRPQYRVRGSSHRQ